MKRSSQALLSKSIAESKGKLHAFSRGPRRKVNTCAYCINITAARKCVLQMIYLLCVYFLQDDDGGIDEEYDDAWVQVFVLFTA